MEIDDYIACDLTIWVLHEGNYSQAMSDPSETKTFHDHRRKANAWVRLTDKIEEARLVEDGHDPWNTPSLTAPKKKPGEYRLVEDFRALTDATVDDAHSLPKIEEILQGQGGNQMWSVMDGGTTKCPSKKNIAP